MVATTAECSIDSSAGQVVRRSSLKKPIDVPALREAAHRPAARVARGEEA